MSSRQTNGSRVTTWLLVRPWMHGRRLRRVQSSLQSLLLLLLRRYTHTAMLCFSDAPLSGFLIVVGGGFCNTAKHLQELVQRKNFESNSTFQ